MEVVKNEIGVSYTYNQKVEPGVPFKKFGGSSLNRKKYPKKETNSKKLDKRITSNKVTEKQLRRMSARTKSKIRQKIFAFARVQQKLTFVTLTFVNDVTDRKAIKILKNFLDNAKKIFKDFQYIWVAERQTKNEAFKENIHFHLITNKYWSLEKWWNYWLSIQAKNGIVPRDENYKPTSAFNVRLIKSNNIKGIGTYLTKYVTKNSSQFNCQVWNCSQKISHLNTCIYTGPEIFKKFETLQKHGLIDGEIKNYKKEYCTVTTIPLNEIVMKIYDPINEQNEIIWNETK